MKKIIKYYRRSVYGQTYEYIHPDNQGEEVAIRHLTGQKTICLQTRNLLKVINPDIEWTEVLAPNSSPAPMREFQI